MHYFFDTEFIEDGRTIDLVSIGIVSGDGREIYLESAEAALERANPWVVEHVLPHLGPVEGRVSRAAMRQAIVDFAVPDGHGGPWFVGYYASYDWVALCQLFGCMIDLPKGWPMFVLDLRQVAFHRGAEIAQPNGAPHHALSDARWIKDAWERLAVLMPK